MMLSLSTVFDVFGVGSPTDIAAATVDVGGASPVKKNSAW
jgi:hypothetical protein